MKTAFKDINYDMKIVNPRSRVLKLMRDWTIVPSENNLKSSTGNTQSLDTRNYCQAQA